MFGLYVMLFAKKKIQTRVGEIASCAVSMGMTGGNNGATCLRFTYENTTFSFANCQLR